MCWRVESGSGTSSSGLQEGAQRSGKHLLANKWIINLFDRISIQIDTRVAPVVGRLGPSKKKKKKPQQDVSMVTNSGNKKSGCVYDIWGASNEKKITKEWVLSAIKYLIN